MNSETRFSRVVNMFRHRATAMFGLFVFVAIVLAILAAPIIAPVDPEVMSPVDSLLPPSWAHPFGTDIFGRDQLSRVLYGGRISLGVGLLSVALALLIGVPLGLIAGYWRGWADRLVSQYTDVMLAFPYFLLALIIVFVLGPNLHNVVLAVGVSSSPTFVRLVRGSVMQVSELPFVEAARAVGCTNLRIILRHILPNILSPIIIVSTLGLGSAILSAAALSFLGAGVQPPTAEWGVMLDEGRTSIRIAWWLTLIPGLAIMLAVVSINLIGDGLRDALDPRAA